MQRTARALLALAGVAALAVMTVGPAQAAAPGNDVYPGATAVTLGFSQTLDTTQATTDADDVSINQQCGAPATDASVWYSLTPAADEALIVNTSASSFTSGVIVAVGSPGSFSVVACGPGAVVFSAAAGTTYSILAFDFQGDGGGNGGQLTISFEQLPAAPTVSVAVDPVGRMNAKTGTASLSGSITCTDAFFADIFGRLEQRVGRGSVIGEFSVITNGQCDGQPYRWTAEVRPLNGKFAGGKSAAVAFSFACGPYECSSGFTEQNVQLRSGKK